MIELLIALAAFAVFVALGHGIWVFVAAFLRVVFGSPERPETSSSTSQRSFKNPLREDLLGTLRQLDVLLSKGAIDLPTYSAMKLAVNRELERMSGAATQSSPVYSPPKPAAPAETPWVPEADSAPISPDEASEDVEPAPWVAPSPVPLLVPTTPKVRSMEKPAALVEPRKPVSEILLTFMQERNIRWGVLLASTIVVFCSIAMVVTLWSQIAANPFWRVLLFVGVNAAIFGVGAFAYGRLALPLTGRALLIVATLLVPLNLLAIAALGQGTGGTEAMEWVAAAVFTVMVFFAGRVVCPPWPAALVLGVMVPATAQLLARRWITPESDVATLRGVVGIPLAGYLVACGWAVAGAWNWRGMGRTKTHAIFSVLGLSSFAAAAAAGLAVYKFGRVGFALREISPLIALHALPGLAVGLMLSQRLTRKHLGTLRTAGISVAVIAGGLFAGALTLAWPQPVMLVLVSAIGFVALCGAAVVFGIPAAHLPGAACFTFAYLLLFHIARGNLEWRIQEPQVLWNATLLLWSGTALCGAVVLLGGAAAMFAKVSRKGDAKWLGIAAGGVAAVSLLCTTLYGFGRLQDAGATWVYLFYALAAIAGAWGLTPEDEVEESRGLPGAPGSPTTQKLATYAAWAGAILLLGAVAQAVVFRYKGMWIASDETTEATLWQVALLMHATLITIWGSILYTQSEPPLRRTFGVPFTDCGLIVSAIAMGLVVAATWGTTWETPAYETYMPVQENTALFLGFRTLWVAAIWLTVALVRCRPWVFTAFEAATAWATLMFAYQVAKDESTSDVFTAQLLSTSLAVVALGWVLLRSAAARTKLGRTKLGETLIVQNWSARVLEWVVNGGLMVVLVMLCAEARHVVFWEFRGGEMPGFYADALGVGSWVLLGVLMASWAAGWIEKFDGKRLLLVILGAFCATLLIAGQYTEHRDAASVVTWLRAGLWLIGAAALVWREKLPNFAGVQATWLRRAVRAEFIVLAVLPIVGFTLYALLLILDGRTIPGPLDGSFFHKIGFTASYGLPLLAVAVGFAAFADRERVSRYPLAAAVAVNLATTVFWVDQQWNLAAPRSIGPWLDLMNINLFALALPAALFAWIENRRGDEPSPFRAYYVTATITASTFILTTIAAGLTADFISEDLITDGPVAGAALLACFAAMAACATDRKLLFPFAGMYLLGLCGVGFVVDRYNLAPHWVFYALTAGGAGYTLLVAEMLRWRRPLRAWALLHLNTALSTLVMVFGLLIALTWSAHEGATPEKAVLHRFLMAAAMLLPAGAALLLRMRKRTLSYLATAAVAFAWARVEPDSMYGDVLHRAVWVMTALGLTASAYGFGLVKQPWASERWVAAARRIVKILAGLTCASLLFVLGVETLYQLDRGSVPLAPVAIGIVIATIVAMVVTLIVWAVAPGRDPLSLAERGRMAYVYAAEVLLALLFLHIRLSMPQLFHGFLSQYWPLIVMAIAFTGIGLGEFFRRKNTTVLASPLERTGAFLPLLPVLGYWVANSRVDYSLQLVLVGMLYGVLAMTRKNFGFGLLAALAANGGLWYFLHRQEGWGFFEHPQLWLIPASLCVIIASYLNRKNLLPQQMGAIRYSCMMIVYVSSTADIFIAGVADSPWLPLILAAFSVAGVLAGMAWKVRSFLFLGASFLLLSMVTLVAHASKQLDSAWPVWAAGISMGLAVIALFAVFEKQRSRVTRVVEGLKRWEA